jgi:hypothetical protein
MSTPKTEVASMLKVLPEDSTFEDIQYHLYVLEKIKKGLERAEAEGGIPHDQARERLSKWLSV